MPNQQYELFMWISLGIFGLELVCYLPIKIFMLKRYLKQKNKENGFVAIFNYAISGTIFTYVDNLNSENTQVSLNRLSSNSGRKQSSIGTLTIKREIQLQQEEYNSAIICDCYECFCDGCPWQMKSDWTRKLSKFFEKMQNKILQKLKIIGFITIELLSFVYLPLNNLVYFSNSVYCITFFGILFQTLQFYVLSFTFSFITTKREMVRLDSDTDRGLLTYYHLRKSQLFSVMTLLVLIVLSFILKHQFDQSIQKSRFIFYNSFYTFASYMILFLLLRFNKCLRNDLIQDNDNILKGEQKLHTIENNLIKYFPSATEFQQYIQQNDAEQDSEELSENIQQIMEQKCTEAKQNLQNSLQAVEKQQFKKIKKNLGVKKLSITILTLYIYINLFLLTPISIIVCLQSLDKQQKLIPNSEIYVLLYLILNVVQFTFYPFMLGIMFNKKALFGQDYGQWESNQ